MKSKAIGTLVSTFIIIVSTFLIIFFNESPTAINIGIGVLGSGVVSFVMTFSEYFVEKRFVQERYCSAVYKILVRINKITYMPINEETRLIVEYNYERQSNKALSGLETIPHTTAFQKLCDYYNEEESIDWGVFIPNDKRTQVIIDARLQVIKTNIENVMKSYISIESVSLEEMENAYGELFFISDLFKLKKYRKITEIYLAIHEKIREMYNSIILENYHFNLYFSAENGNLPIMVSKIEQCNNKLFWVEKLNDSDSAVWAKWFNELFDTLEDFRCDIYGDKHKKRNHQPIVKYIKGMVNLEFYSD